MKSQPPVRLLVGLGNPGNEYADTRHNAGIWFIDALLRQFAPSTQLQAESKFHGSTASISIGGQPLRVFVPGTYMNLSGQAVAAITNFFKFDIASVLVVHDELDIEPGTVRLKTGGGHGGHNGLRDIIEKLGKQKGFGRLRIGIGHPGNANQVSNYVLKKPTSNDAQLIEVAIDESLRHIDSIVTGDWQIAMNDLHRFDASE